jgi:hypothetical protein
VFVPAGEVFREHDAVEAAIGQERVAAKAFTPSP